ncbi:MAG: plasmid stabilization protein [Candidatus Harrisonbacteria bacterium CG10_big_fil_rev_8_21_14_0_10_49_15]|uniref:Plasmid stabilization protein n=1 Tax=Candidatus Harrisonbacteria bacterium CG10_big_fil_rev_8_21_14_0_10_49_15 TaxID=1974587 RepID=A0A2H0ULP3_9BACT|nr:MAG: plasmid stabilization protein [Candidatus Harrisonbacteria bacterium CG10_big_fil_rev_8_21_14_0_10_49_15]
MKRLLTTPRFDRRLERFVRRHPELKDVVFESMTALLKNSPPQSLKLHKLGGILKGCYGASVSHAYRLVFVMDSDSVCFLDVGTHDEVYR